VFFESLTVGVGQVRRPCLKDTGYLSVFVEVVLSASDAVALVIVALALGAPRLFAAFAFEHIADIVDGSPLLSSDDEDSAADVAGSDVETR
jgi:hypothetical protein